MAPARKSGGDRRSGDEAPNQKAKIQVISRAASVLRAFDGGPEGLSISEISARSGIARSSVHRIVSALEAEGFLVAASPTERVRLGPELTRLAAMVTRDLKDDVRPLMQYLAGRLGETVDCSVLEGDHVRLIDLTGTPSHPLQAVSNIDALFPAHSTAAGKALLAALPPESLDVLLSARLESFTGRTITRRADLKRELEEVRRIGVAFDHDEANVGISAAAITVEDSAGQSVAIAVPMPTQRFDGRLAEITEILLAARDDARKGRFGNALRSFGG
jgi:DNA-binding IclR family transcriptional regulator